MVSLENYAGDLNGFRTTVATIDDIYLKELGNREGRTLKENSGGKIPQPSSFVKALMKTIWKTFLASVFFNFLYCGLTFVNPLILK